MKPTQTPNMSSKFNFVRCRYIFFGLSFLFACIGVFMLLTTPPNLDIEFKAGTALDVTINQPIDQEKATQIMEDAGIPPATIAIAGQNSNQIAARFDDVLDAKQVNTIVNAFKESYGSSVAFTENTADPIVAQELVYKAIIAITLAILGMFLFVFFRFGWTFAIAATLGVLNSAFFVLSVFAIFKYEIDITFIAAILTVIGYSMNDTIVVFDRIRENLANFEPNVDESSHQTIANLINLSIWQTLRRSIYTVLTVIAGALSLYFFGAEPLQMFSLAIFFGLVCGAYSSICIAAPLLLFFQKDLLAKFTGKQLRISVQE